MFNYYEDTMPLLTNQDEYLKYYFDETLPTFDKLNIIIKKGESFQRQALMKNLIVYVKESLFKSLIQFIISDIGTWDSETALLFPQSLYTVLINTDYIIDNELFNIIFKHMVDSVSVGDEKKKDEYTFYFNKVIEFYSINNPKNLLHNFPYSINNDIIEYIVSLGKFGQTANNRRLCAYLSASICRIINVNSSKSGKKILENYLQQLYKRLSYLFWDGDKIIEAQMVRELLYIIPIFKDKMFANEDINLALESYINNDTDHIIQTMSIIALLKNLIHISNYSRIIEVMLNKIKEIVEDNDYEELYKNSIIDNLINILYEVYLNIPEEIINDVFKLGIFQTYYSYDTISGVHIQNLDKVSFLYEFLLNNNKNGNDSPDSASATDSEKNELSDSVKLQLNFDEIFIKMYDYIFNEKNNNNNIIDVENNYELIEYINNTNKINKKINVFEYYSTLENIEGMFNSLTKTKITNAQNGTRFLKALFYLNLPHIMPCISTLKTNKNIFDKILNMFQKNNIIVMLKIYSFNIDKITLKKNGFYELVLELLKRNYVTMTTQSKQISNKNIKHLNRDKEKENLNVNETNNIYYKILNVIISNIILLYEDSPALLTSNIHLMLSKILKMLIPKFYKYFKNITFNTLNLNVESITLMINNDSNQLNKDVIKVGFYEKIFENIFNNLVSKIIINNKLGDYIIREYVESLPYFILYSKKRNFYFDFVKNKIFFETSFYKRKYSIVFYEQCFKILSLDFFQQMNLMNNFIILMKDKTNLISTNIIALIYKYNLKIISYSINSFQKLCSMLNEIYDYNTKSFNEDKKNFDKDKSILINKIISLKNSINFYYSKDEVEDYKEKENILVLKENDIMKYEKNFDNKNNNSSTNIIHNNQHSNLFLLHNNIKNNGILNCRPINSSFATFQSSKNNNLLNSNLFKGRGLINNIFNNSYSINQFSLSQKERASRKTPWVEKTTLHLLNGNKHKYVNNSNSSNNNNNYLPKIKGSNNIEKDFNRGMKSFEINNCILDKGCIGKSVDKSLLKSNMKKLSLNKERLPIAKIKIKNNYPIVGTITYDDINSNIVKKKGVENYNNIKTSNNTFIINNKSKNNSNKYIYDFRPNSKTKNKKEKNCKIYINANKYEESYATYK